MKSIDVFKSAIALIILSLFTITSINACAVCGCGPGGYYLGISPQFNTNAIGIRYRSFTFDSHLKFSPVLRTKEYFNVAELYGRYYPHKKIQVQFFLPYQMSRQETQTKNLYLNGVGDASVLAQYNFLNKNTTWKERKIQNQIWAGVGIKAPTGTYRFIEENEATVSNPNFQLGTGSWDFIFSAQHLLRVDKWGLNTQVNYKLNTENSNKYLFGNQFMNSLSLFRVIQIQKWGINPQAGLTLEYQAQNLDDGFAVVETGGHWFGGQIGLSIFYDRFSLDILHQAPINQSIGQGHLRLNNRNMAQLSFLF